VVLRTSLGRGVPLENLILHPMLDHDQLDFANLF